MIKRWMFRVLVGLAFAIPMGMVSVALAQTEGGAPVTEAQTQDCRDCHESFQTAWMGGAHGPASEAFQQAWEGQGQPQTCVSCHTLEGVSCESCHSPVFANHPDTPVSIDRSAETCGKCHAESYLGWQVSKHGSKDLVCANCHDAHGTTQKNTETSILCSNCHESRTIDFAHSSHNQVGLLCTDCHLTPPDDPGRDPHAVRDHSFDVKLSTCNRCHVSEIHTAMVVAEIPVLPTPTPDPMTSGVVAAGVTEIPEPVSPLGFALIAIMLGFGAGIVVSPWLERWYRRGGREFLK
jgi:hypothetical protein